MPLRGLLDFRLHCRRRFRTAFAFALTFTFTFTFIFIFIFTFTFTFTFTLPGPGYRGPAFSPSSAPSPSLPPPGRASVGCAR